MSILMAVLLLGTVPAHSQRESADKALQELDREAAKHEKAREPAPKPAVEPLAEKDHLKQGADDIGAVLDKVNASGEKIEELDKALDQAVDYIKNSDLTGPNKELYLKKIEEAKEALAKNTSLYGSFASAAGKTKEVLDLVVEVSDLKATADQYAANQGQGASSLAILAWLGEKLGDKVPVLGDAIAGYSKITTELLKATDRLSQDIKENQQQGAMGQGGQSTGERFEALKKLLGEDGAKAQTWLPTAPGWIYTTDGGGPDLVWNEKTKSWLTAPKGTAESVYWKDRQAGQDPSPETLVALCQPDMVKKAADMEAAAADYLKLLKSCAGGLGDEYLVFSDANGKAGGALRGWLKDPRLFAVRYAYNGAFRGDAQKELRSLYEALSKKLPADSPLLAGMRAWAKGQGLELAAVAADPPGVLACAKSEQEAYDRGVVWLPRIHDKDAFSKFSCQPMHSAQETPSKACCDAYYGTRNEKGMWDKAWDVLQECGWKDEIAKRKAAYDKKLAECRAQENKP
jgi:hypothetical protein